MRNGSHTDDATQAIIGFLDLSGRGHERRQQGAEGLKKLDVIYATAQAGLRLSISIETINFKDEATKRYTKNIKRVDGELRAEPSDCHKYNPYAVLVGIIFFPTEAASDGIDGRSSLKHGWDVFRRRGGRNHTMTTLVVSKFFSSVHTTRVLRISARSVFSKFLPNHQTEAFRRTS